MYADWKNGTITAKSAYDIMGFLEENGIVAERRSVYRDIEEINKANLIIQEDYTIDETEVKEQFAEYLNKTRDMY